MDGALKVQKGAILLNKYLKKPSYFKTNFQIKTMNFSEMKTFWNNSKPQRELYSTV